MWTPELRQVDTSISDLRISIANLELKVSMEQNEIDDAHSTLAKIAEALAEKKLQLFRELENFHKLLKEPLSNSGSR